MLMLLLLMMMIHDRIVPSFGHPHQTDHLPPGSSCAPPYEVHYNLLHSSPASSIQVPPMSCHVGNVPRGVPGGPVLIKVSTPGHLVLFTTFNISNTKY